MRLAWPPALDDRLRDLWGQDLTFPKIARKLQRKTHSVAYRARKLGLSRVAQLTTGEVKVMQVLRDDGLTLGEIAEQTGRCIWTVMTHTTRRTNGKTRSKRSP